MSSPSSSTLNSTSTSTALIGIEVSLLRGLETLRWACESLQRFSEVTAVSSVVQCNTVVDNPLLKIVLKVSLTIPPEQIVQELLSIEYEFESKITVIESLRCFLLVFDHQVSLSPGVTLPHPQMLDHTSWLYCCCEVWRGYRHPVLDLNLDRLLAERDVSHMEFFGQGKSVITKAFILSPNE